MRMKVGPKTPPGIISEQLRAIVGRSESTIYRIEQDAGIPRGGLLRFASGEGSLTLGSVDRLARTLGLRLVEVERKVGNRKPKAGRSARVEPNRDVITVRPEPERSNEAEGCE